jgi:hypothetical protein
VLAGSDVDEALQRYRRRHRRFMAGHHLMMSDFASGRPMNPIERTLHKAAVHDPATARFVHELGSRAKPLDHVLRPGRLARAAMVAVSR